VNAQDDPFDQDKRWLHRGYLLLGALLLWRLAYIASGLIELSQDEALYWLQSKHLALSYYSKPPLTAYTQFIGTALWGDNDFGVRFFSPVISALIGFVCLRFCARELNARLGFVLVLIISAIPLLMVGSTLMTIDPLSVLFWTAAMLTGWRAVQPDGSARHWLWVGLWMGLGFLSKYTGLFQLLCWVLFFALWPPARVHLRRPGPYLALLVNFLVALPVLIWNAQHDWVTVTHVGGRADFGHLSHFTARFLFEFIGAEIALLNPVFFAGMIWAGIAFWRARPRDPRMIYFFSMGAPLVFAYLLQSLHARVLPNWIAPAVVPGLFLMVLYWDGHRRLPRVRRLFHGGLILGLISMIVVSDTDVIKIVTGHHLPMSINPLRRVRGWSETARQAGGARQTLLQEGKPVFIICPGYASASEMTFYLPEAKASVPNQAIVYCWGADKPITEFYYWPEYDYRQRVGDNAIFMKEVGLVSGKSDPQSRPELPPDKLVRQFRSVKYIGTIHADFRGRPVRWFQLFECRDLLPEVPTVKVQGFNNLLHGAACHGEAL
jgi:4-amino-4-deoxy-L-arabinose transferase-like glycosyltransferase